MDSCVLAVRLKCVLLFLLLVTGGVQADEHSHVYEDREEVVVWMNTIGPYHNRQETYKYFSLPFCKGPLEEVGHHHETMGEALQGVELEFSGLEIGFKDTIVAKDYCSFELTEEKMKAFVYAIKNHYWYQMYLDDLPMWGVVGEVVGGGENGEEYVLWTKKKFEIGYSGNQIVEVNLTTEGKTKLEKGITLTFSYQVVWRESKIPFAQRFNKYLDPNFFQHRIHWFSIFNSFMMVIFLVGLVSMILMRTLRKDYARYSREEGLDDLERDIGDEYGWKQVHGDVFRTPAYPVLFTALVGTGFQLATVALGCILIELTGHLYMQRGTLLSTAIFLYATTSPVNGYFGGSLYSKFRGMSLIV